MCIRDRLWGRPARRRFQRRHQSYRVSLCAGLEQLWQLIRDPETDGQISEWTVSYTHLRAHETVLDIVCRLLLEKKKNKIWYASYTRDIYQQLVAVSECSVQARVN